MAVDPAGFYVRFPSFDLTDYETDPPDGTPNGRQDALVTATLAGAEAQTDRTIYATDALADEAVMYLAAHLLSRSLSSMNARLQASRSDKAPTGDDIYWDTYRRLARAATAGFRST